MVNGIRDSRSVRARAISSGLRLDAIDGVDRGDERVLFYVSRRERSVEPREARSSV